jgi:alkylation response protein AidB-like acyl-CoA dehydrogenase
MAGYLTEELDRLAHGGEDKRRRYDTERYLGAVGLNWYRADPSLQRLLHRHLGEQALAWAEPHLDRVGELMGGAIAERAEQTDVDRPRLERYDRWGRDISRVVMPASAEASRRQLLADSFADPAFQAEAREAGANSSLLTQTWNYLLSQAEIGMFCALGTGGDMVLSLAREYAPLDVAARVDEALGGGMLSGETAQLFTERTGGSDLGALETTASRDGDAWRVSGYKWFVSNVNGAAFVVLAKPEGAPDSSRGVLPFLVLWERRDGSRNGISIRRLKDKLGTHAVASAEVELRGAEAFLLAPDPDAPREESAGGSGGGRGVGSGLARMMSMTNGARLGISVMGLGCARRALVESLCYAASREAFGAPLDEHPLMRRKLAELIVEVEAAQALVFDGYLSRLRIGAPLIKLRAARLGITVASDAIEIHGGNGYIEQWPVARILRDAQVNTVWEGPDNILCLDVRRAMEKEAAHEPLLERIRTALTQAPDDTGTATAVEQQVEGLEKAIAHWRTLSREVAEARLFPLAQYMVDVYAAALLLEQAGWEERALGSDRGTLVARLYTRAHLAERGPLRGIDDPAEDLERFTELRDGALRDDRG